MRIYVVAVLLLIGCTEAAVVDNIKPEKVVIVGEPVEVIKPNDDITEPFAMSHGTVGRIIDGDTIVLDDERKTKLRIAYIDCPEKGEPWFDEGCVFANLKLAGKKIKYWDLGPDKYKRTLSEVYYSPEDNNDVVNYGRELVREGLAKRYKDRQSEYTADEEFAKSNKVGIWSEDKVLPDIVSSSESVTY